MALGTPNRLRTQSFCAPISTLRRGGIDFLTVREVYLIGRLRAGLVTDGEYAVSAYREGEAMARCHRASQRAPGLESAVAFGGRSCAAALGGEPWGLRMDRAGGKKVLKIAFSVS